jgi:hypothetical protein
MRRVRLARVRANTRQTVSTPYLVQYDADAVMEHASLSSKEEKKAVFSVVDKLRLLGPKLVPPHMKPLKGEPGLLELRPPRARRTSERFTVESGMTTWYWRFASNRTRLIGCRRSTRQEIAQADTIPSR